MKRLCLIAGLIAPLLLVGCSTTTIRVPVPPRVDLGTYPMIGLVTFSSNADADLEQFCTQKFLEAMQSAQPGTRVVELGPESRVLQSVDRRGWDVTTMRAIKDMHGVDVIITGWLDVQKSKPKVSLSTEGLKSLSVSANVDVALSAKLVEAETGASMWTDSAKLTTNVANAHFNERGGGRFGGIDPEAVYGDMVNRLVYEVTDDFRMHYIKKRVPKDQVYAATASGQAAH